MREKLCKSGMVPELNRLINKSIERLSNQPERHEGHVANSDAPWRLHLRVEGARHGVAGGPRGGVLVDNNRCSG